jgi:hypothetical protein
VWEETVATGLCFLASIAYGLEVGTSTKGAPNAVQHSRLGPRVIFQLLAEGARQRVSSNAVNCIAGVRPVNAHQHNTPLIHSFHNNALVLARSTRTDVVFLGVSLHFFLVSNLVAGNFFLFIIKKTLSKFFMLAAALTRLSGRCG